MKDDKETISIEINKEKINIDCDCEKICVIKNNNTEIKDINNNIEIKDIKDIKDIEKKYKERRNKLKFQDPKFSTVWIMVAVAEEKQIIQVGQNKSLDCMFKNDLNKDISYIISSDNNKESNRKKKYREIFEKNRQIKIIEIFEVNIDKFLDNIGIGLPIGINKYFNEEMLFYIKSLYVEGLIAYYSKAKLWNRNPSGIDGMTYDLFEKILTYKNNCDIM